MPGDTGIDLTVIDEAYGKDADLYVDVLRVSGLSSQEEIKAAFFDRRSELFAILSKLTDNAVDEITMSQRRFAERRMDAVVMAFRILKDPHLRQQYATMRKGRFQRKSEKNGKAVGSNQENTSPVDETEKKGRSKSKAKSITAIAPMVTPEKVASQKTSATESVQSDEQRTPTSKRRTIQSQPRQPPRRDSFKITVEESPAKRPSCQQSEKQHKKGDKSRKPRGRVTPPPETDGDHEYYDDDDDDETLDDTLDDTMDDTLDDTLEADRWRYGVVDRVQRPGIIQQVKEEVEGSCMDTYLAFDQVINAFTLQEADINAVIGRINKVKSQLRGEFYVRNHV